MMADTETAPAPTPEAPPAPAPEAPPSGRDDKGRFAPKATNGNGADPAPDGDGDAPAPTPQQMADWRKNLPDDDRKWAEKFTSLEAKVKSHRELEKKLAKAAFKPGDKATDEERAAWRRQLGVPDEPAGYGVSVPRDLPEGIVFDEAAVKRLNGFVEHMHKLSAAPDVVKGATDFYFGMLAQQYEDHQRMLERGREQAVEELDREWGDDKPANLTYARRLRQQFDTDNQFAHFLETAIIDGKKAGDHPAINKFLAKAGRAMSEDSVHLAPDENETVSINRQIDKVREQKERAMSSGNHSRAQQLDEEERRLYTQLHGSAPVVGAAGRTM